MKPSAPSSSLELLRAALAAVHIQDHAAARDALVAVWRERRSPVIAELVDLLDARAPDATTARLAALVTPRVVTSLAAFKKLAKLDDPRLASFILDALVNLPFTSPTAKPYLDALAAGIDRLGDPRLVERAPAIRAAVSTRITRMAVRDGVLARVDKALARLAPLPAPPAAEFALEQAITVAAAALRTTARSAATLLADIYANPADDAPRLVYADLLLEQGDPRGELITLQIERTRSTPEPEPSEREQELLKKHGKAWLGSLAPVVSWGKGYARTQFRRGFVSRADIILSVGKKLLPIMADPAWATVEEFAGLYDKDLWGTAPLRALREVEITEETVELLAARTEPLVSVVRAQLDEPIDLAVLRRVLPNLACVWAYRPSMSRAVVDAFTICGVAHVEVRHYHVDAGQLAAARALFDAFVASLVGHPAITERLTLAPPFTGRQPERSDLIELRRGADGQYERVA